VQLKRKERDKNWSKNKAVECNFQFILY